MNTLIFNIMIAAHRLVKGIANRVLDKSDIRSRNFSNKILRKYASHFSGDMINVSAWKDEDGEGGHYKSYFVNAKNYTVSNVEGQEKGFGAASPDYNAVELDLLKELPDSLKEKFDVVFNHTTLEHVYDFTSAFRHLCELSSDIVIITVPVMQQIHNTVDFGDYWRPTTMNIARQFQDNGFEPLVIKCNDQPFAPIYCFAIGSRKPELYKEKFAKEIDFEMGRHNYGSGLNKEGVEEILKNNRET